MDTPHVRNVLNDPNQRIRYEVMAYRELTRTELLQSVGLYLRRAKRKPKAGSVVTIITIIGFDESIQPRRGRPRPQSG